MVPGLLLILSFTLLGVGITRDARQSELDKGTDGGPLDGTLRPASWRGFRRGLPWYALGGILLVVFIVFA
ncbi:MAG: hypothetical protein ABIQ92_09590 [Ornithinibacter sp.]